MIISSQGGAAPDRTKGMIDMAATPKTLNTTEIAAEFGTDSRTLRKFLRSEAGTNSKVGKGARWALRATEVSKLRKRFAEWDAARTAPDAPETDAPAPEGTETEQV